MINSLAVALGISPEALTVPDIDSYICVMHTLFALEDLYGLRIKNLDGELCITLDKFNSPSFSTMFDMFSTWQKGTISSNAVRLPRMNTMTGVITIQKSKWNVLRQHLTLARQRRMLILD